MKPYKLTLKKSEDGGSKVVAKDPKSVQFVNEVHLDFSKDGRLKKIKTLKPVISTLSEFFSSKKKWSGKKLVMDKHISSGPTEPLKQQWRAR